ncbi:hypothetical protein HOY80DRAFT_176905 [Tuber brumale]|nr:hypothetical protein HOY80DRAFT_176905 [Tuber brumale]
MPLKPAWSFFFFFVLSGVQKAQVAMLELLVSTSNPPSSIYVRDIWSDSLYNIIQYNTPTTLSPKPCKPLIQERRKATIGQYQYVLYSTLFYHLSPLKENSGYGTCWQRLDRSCLSVRHVKIVVCMIYSCKQTVFPSF